MKLSSQLCFTNIHSQNQVQEQQERVKRHTLEDIKSEEEIDGLTVRQMKEVLVNNFVDYKGCVEKSELHLRVTRLWKEHQVNKQKSKSKTDYLFSISLCKFN